MRELLGLEPPRLTTAQRNAIPQARLRRGMVIFNTDTSSLQVNTAADGAAGVWAEAGGPLATNAQTGTTYTLVLTDKNKIVELNNAGAITLTVPDNATAAFGIGDMIHLLQTGAGQVTVVGGAGVTVNGNPGLKLAGQWAMATLLKRATNTWVLFGNISA